jgi:hypothetical protein
MMAPSSPLFSRRVEELTLELNRMMYELSKGGRSNGKTSAAMDITALTPLR